MDNKVIIGGGLAFAGVIFLVMKARAAPEPPEPGMSNFYGKVSNAVTGGAIAGAEVMLDNMTEITDSSGNFLFENIEPGVYSLSVLKEGYESWI